MCRLRWQLLLLIVLLACVAQAGFARTARADDKTYHWDYIYVDIAVRPNGDMEIVETQRYVFTRGSFSFAYREIPLDRVESIDDVWVEEDGQRYGPGQLKTQYLRDDLRITWYYPQTRNAARTFRIHYVVHGGLRIYDGGDQLWWKAIFKDRDFAVNSARVTVRLPASVASSDLKIATYGAPAEYEIVDLQTVRFAAGRIKAGQELEVRVQFPHGLVSARAPSWQAAFDRQRAYDENVRPTVTLLAAVFSAFIFLAGALGIVLWWYVRGRDRSPGLVAEYLSEPPSELPPGLAGVLVDEKADMRDIIATLVDLARRGIIQMTEVPVGGILGIGNRRDFTFNLVEEDAEVRPFEREVLGELFGVRSERRLSDLKEKFYRAIPGIRRAMYAEVVQAGYFPRSPEATRGRYRVLGGLVLVLGILAAVVVGNVLRRYTDAALCPGLAIVGTGVALLVASGAMPRRTGKGAEEAARWRAFRRYLADIERYTNLSAAKEIFDRYLPYAIAFGLDREWVRKFAEVDAPAPPWYTPYPPVIIPGGTGAGCPATRGRTCRARAFRYLHCRG